MIKRGKQQVWGQLLSNQAGLFIFRFRVDIDQGIFAKLLF